MRKTAAATDSASKRLRTPRKNNLTTQKRALFPIVGIGASAGGLEALEQFMRQVPPGCGLAHIVAPVADLPGKILGFLSHSIVISTSEFPMEEKDQSALEKVMILLRTLGFSEKQVTTNNGRWFTVRIMPYRTIEAVIGGVVITFVDSTSFKHLEVQLLEENTRLKSLLESRNN